jgi:hypothetical protein
MKVFELKNGFTVNLLTRKDIIDICKNNLEYIVNKSHIYIANSSGIIQNNPYKYKYSFLALIGL